MPLIGRAALVYVNLPSDATVERHARTLYGLIVDDRSEGGAHTGPIKLLHLIPKFGAPGAKPSRSILPMQRINRK